MTNLNIKNDITILFSYIKLDELTSAHYKVLQHLNPGVPIVPITSRRDKGSIYLDNTTIASEYDSIFREEVIKKPWDSTDIPIYIWYMHARTPETTAHRYVYIEYDMLFKVSIKEFYDKVWDADAANPCLPKYAYAKYYNDPRWVWFKQLHRLPPEMRGLAAGVWPLAGSFMSDKALSAITSGLIPKNVFCELRLGTLFNFHGFEMQHITQDYMWHWPSDFQVVHPMKDVNVTYEYHKFLTLRDN